MKWISVREALPEKSGKYMVACTHEGERKPYYYEYINYSTKHKQWNNYDNLAKDDNVCFKDVSYWAEIDKPEVD